MEDIHRLNCKTGEDFEKLVLDTLQILNFEELQIILYVLDHLLY